MNGEFGFLNKPGFVQNKYLNSDACLNIPLSSFVRAYYRLCSAFSLTRIVVDDILFLKQVQHVCHS